jgi:hypothetical protein
VKTTARNDAANSPGTSQQTVLQVVAVELDKLQAFANESRAKSQNFPPAPSKSDPSSLLNPEKSREVKRTSSESSNGGSQTTMGGLKDGAGGKSGDGAPKKVRA